VIVEETLFGPVDETEALIERLMAKLQSLVWVEGKKEVRWPADPTRDRLLVKQLVAEYPMLDLIEEIEKWSGKLLDLNSRKKVHPRARFKNWCINADKYARRDGRFGPGGRRMGTQGQGGPRARPGGTPVNTESVESGYTTFD
jgi:hypothetical protein